MTRLSSLLSAAAIGTAALCSIGQTAQAQLSESIGNYASAASDGANAWKLKASNGLVRIQVITPSIVRIRFAKQDSWEELSYAVVGAPVACKVDVKEEATATTYTTDSLVLVVEKNPIRIKLLNKKGAVVNEDEPAFGSTFLGEEVTTYKKMQKGERFVGLGEKTGSLDRKGEGYTLWNTDYFGYPSGADPIYQSIPFYIGIHSGVQYGVFFDNSHKSHFNFGASNDRFSSFTAEAGEMNYYLIYNSTMPEILKSYTYLTGRMPMPPMWGLGLQQSRYSYYPEAEVKTLARTFREKGIPADAIVLDIHYMDKYKIFTWDKSRFPDPKRMTTELKQMGFRTVAIHDPGIKVEKGYRGYEEGMAKDLFVKYPDGKQYTGQVWPGWCHFPDFTKQATRDWWRESLKYSYVDNGVEGFWNDMNEPASWGQKMPNNIIFDFEGKPGTHRKAHNIYGLQMSKASYEAGRALTGKRPFILTRAGYAGIQRYSAVWTGDNRSEEDHMMSGVRLLNSMGLSGVSYTGMDVGGFTGGPSPSLFARWVSIGAFSPFFRIHSAIDTKEADAWSFGEKVEAISKSYISLRYRLLPYLYSAFAESNSTGLPVNRSMAIAYTHDAKIYDGRYQNQFMFGPSILVAPSESNKEYTKVYLPDDQGWYDLYTDKQYKGKEELLVESPIEKLPVFVRGGSIVPMQSLTMNTMQAPTDTLVLHVYNGKAGIPYTYYEDDGESYSYEKGDYMRRSIKLDMVGRKIVFGKPEGTKASKFKTVQILLHGFAGSKTLGTDSMVKFVDALPNFDPIGSGQQGPMAAVRVLSIAMPAGAADVKF